MIGLDSNISGATLDAQQAWLDAQLKAIEGDGRCVLAMWHHPVFSTGLHRKDGKRMLPAWAALEHAGADLVLNGHEHFYESFERKDSTGNDDPRACARSLPGPAVPACTICQLYAARRSTRACTGCWSYIWRRITTSTPSARWTETPGMKAPRSAVAH